MAQRLAVRSLLAALVAASVSLVGCNRRPEPAATVAPPSPGAAVAQAGQAATSSGASVTARPVSGWGLQENPRPGIAYRYVREQAEGDFRPTVTVVARGAKAASTADARESAFNDLRARYPGIETISDRAIDDWKPPLHQTVYRVTEQGTAHQLMQLYFVRSDGELVTVTFCAHAGQWEYLQTEFQSILAAIQVAP